MEYKVDFINSGYRRYYKKHRKEVLREIDRCYTNGDFVLRRDVEMFEENLADFLKCKHVIGVNSGTDALKIAYKALGIKPGDEVITVGHVFIAPIEEIVHHGATPILIDVKEDGLMDVDLIEQNITSKTVGIVPVHLSGKVCDMDKILQIAKKHNLWVVEDACQALGAKYNGKMAGTIGDIGCFSHIAPKTLGVGGDAGSIVTNSKELSNKCKLLRNHWNVKQGALHGYDPKTPEVIGWGYNSRLDNIHAAVLNVKLKYYPEMLKRRKEIGMRYNRGFSELAKKGLIGLPEQQLHQIYQEYIVKIDDLEKFKKHMDKWGVEILIRDVVPNHKLPGLGLDHFNLPVTDKLAKESIRLPTYPELTNKEINYIISAVKTFYA
jgi:dTDP-4-amino-4,6-dideoxygalactose transaminase